MKRKIIKQGPATLMISLPSKWVKKNNLQRGDEIDLEEKSTNLIISPNQPQTHKKTAIVDITSVDTTGLLNSVLYDLFFIRGYKRLELKIKDTVNPSVKKSAYYYGNNTSQIDTMSAIELFVDSCIGIEIIEEKQGYCVLEEIMSSDPESFHSTLNRGFLLLIQYAENALNELDITERQKRTNNLYARQYFKGPDKFFKYALKLLNSADFPEIEVARNKVLINNIRLAGYAYSMITAPSNKGRDKEQERKILEKTNKALRKFHTQYLKPSAAEINLLADDLGTIQSEVLDGAINPAILNIANILKWSIPYLPLSQIFEVKER